MISGSSCATTKMNLHQMSYEKRLKRLIKSGVNTKEKVDGTAAIFDEVLQESLNYTMPKHTIRHIEQFSERNSPLLMQLMDEIEHDMSGMTILEKLKFGRLLLNQPYVKSMKNTARAVEKKINRQMKYFRVFNRFLKILSPF